MTRTVLVTGSSRNIGRALARRFARAGYHVVLNARSAEALGPVAEEVHDLGAQVLVGAADVRDGDALNEVVDHATSTFGGVDVLINNAVLRANTPIDEMKRDE
jgi:3-oxoacyl-[acyl-carrier protein] reductase